MEEEDMDLRERVAYLIGLQRAEGREQPPDAEIIAGILDVLAELAREVEVLRAEERSLTGRLRSLRDNVAELADDFFGPAERPRTVLVRCEACGQAMRVLASDLDDDQVELVCPSCGHVVHSYDPGLDYDEDEDTLEDRHPGA
jgi:rubrerythrin